MSRMKSRFLLPLALAFVAVFAVACGGNLDEEETTTAAPAAKEASVSIKDFKFQPQELTVKEGTKVTWTNNDASDHTVTAESNEFDQHLKPGEKFSYVFNKKGTFKVNDRLNTQAGLKSTITVE